MDQQQSDELIFDIVEELEETQLFEDELDEDIHIDEFVIPDEEDYGSEEEPETKEIFVVLDEQ